MADFCQEETTTLVISPDGDANDDENVNLLSLAFWLTGVCDGQLLPLNYKKNDRSGDEGQRQEQHWEEQEDGQCPHSHYDSCLQNDKRYEQQASSPVDRDTTTSVVWLHGPEKLKKDRRGRKRKVDTLSQSSSKALPPPSKVPVHIVDEAVLCNLVPFLPRTYARFGLVSQIVPCTLWPPPDSSAHASGKVRCLQEAAAIAARMHHNSLRASAELPSFFSSESPSGVLVEWVAGGVGYTADTEGLWAEQRVVQERYHHLPPLISVDDGDDRDTSQRQEGGRVAVRLQKPPVSLRAAVCEQLRRFRHVEKEKMMQESGGDRWLPRFARLLSMSPESAVMLEQLTANRHVAGASGAFLNTSSCDALLDELLLVGIVPSGEPHRLSLLCLSEAYRMLTEAEHGHKQHSQLRRDFASCHTDSEAVNTKGIAESLLNMILSALTDSLCRRIAVQYELLRLFCIKALALSHRDLLIQYTRWYTSVPAPLAVLHLLAGSTLFGSLMAQRWLPYQPQHGGFVRNVACAKRRRFEKDVDGEQNVDGNEKDNSKREEEKGDNTVECEGEEETRPKPSFSRDADIADGGDDVKSRAVREVLFETDLIADDYLTRFADWLHTKGSGAVTQRKMKDIGMHTNSDSVAATMGGGVAVAGGMCDEAALSTTISWLRRRRRTMTLRELYSFVRKKR